MYQDFTLSGLRRTEEQVSSGANIVASKFKKIFRGLSGGLEEHLWRNGSDSLRICFAERSSNYFARRIRLLLETDSLQMPIMCQLIVVDFR